MRICLISEGSYPYVLGGVSSWIDTLTKSCPEHEFIIYTIYPDSRARGKYKYQLGQNIVEVTGVFLDDIKLEGGKKGRRFKLSKEKHEALEGLLMGDIFSWADIFEFFRDTPLSNVTDFFMSKNFFDLVMSLYRMKYPYTPFTEFIWTIRSIYIILFFLLMKKMPEADIYHSVSTGYAGIMASYGKFLYHKPLILSEHGIYTREREEEIIKADWVKGYYKELWINYFYSLSRCTYDLADVVTSLFATNRGLQIEIGCPEEKIRIIPNGIDLARFEDIPSEKETDKVFIGAIVRITPIKDIKTMLQSFALVKNKVANAEFFIMGPADEDEDYYEECLEMARQLNLEDVHFTGAVDIRQYIGKMDILVLTSLSEGQPLAVMEGMAAKKPHVCTNVGDCRGLMFGDQDHYGQAGFIEFVMDYKGIAQSIIKLCENASMRQEFGLNAYHRVSAFYRKADFILKYKQLYQQVGSEENGGNRL